MTLDDRLPPDAENETELNDTATLPDEADAATTTDEPVNPLTSDFWGWPPTPKMQIILIAGGFGLFNLILIAIWAVVMVYRFS